MKVGEWLGDKFFNINGVVDKKLNEKLENVYRVKTPGKEIQTDLLFNYRQREYKAWALDSASKLLEFYSTQFAPQPFNAERLLFWSWVKDVDVPKLHYSAPQRIINQMKSLLFSQELDINIDSGNKNRDKELKKDLDRILEDNNLYELLQKSVNYETYSGTLAWKPVMDTEVSSSPIVEPYPAESIVFKAKLKKPQEIIFIDEYFVNKKYYYLKSIYGKGYIKYELWDDKFKKQVPLSTVEELKDYKNIVVLGRDGKPIPVLLATYKKNREVNSEFPESLYGGSDFQGVIDSFQLIDELYSQKQLVVRRSRPTQTILDEQLPYNEQTGRTYIPKEYKYDTLVVRKTSDVKDNGRFSRDIPQLMVAEYDNAIQEELKNIFATIGMAYTSVGLEAHSANISGVALETKEKATVIIRNNKIRLWKQFLKESLRLLMIMDSLKTADYSVDEDTITFRIDNLFDYEFQIEFPNYYDLSIDEKVDTASKLINNGIIDRKTAFKRVFGNEYEEAEIDEIVRNSKLESGIPLLAQEVPPPQEE
jgi:hypothetical protein